MKADLEQVLRILDAAGFKRSTENNRFKNTPEQIRAVIIGKQKGRAKLVRGDWSITVGPRIVYFWKGRESGIVKSEDTRKFETRDYAAISSFVNLLDEISIL